MLPCPVPELRCKVVRRGDDKTAEVASSRAHSSERRSPLDICTSGSAPPSFPSFPCLHPVQPVTPVTRRQFSPVDLGEPTDFQQDRLSSSIGRCGETQWLEVLAGKVCLWRQMTVVATFEFSMDRHPQTRDRSELRLM